MGTVINTLVNAEVSSKKAEVADYLKHHAAVTVNGTVPTIVTSQVSPRKTFVGFQFHAPYFDGAVSFDGMPDGSVLAQFVDGRWQ